MSDCFVRYVTGAYITFKHARGVSDKSGTEFHTHHEMIWFMGGQARFISEQLHTELKPNMLILIPRESYHQLLITGPQEEYHRCVFHFSNVPQLEGLIEKSLSEVQLLEMDSRLQDLFGQMVALAANDGYEDCEAVMQAILTLILHQIVQTRAQPVYHSTGNAMVNGCVSYVNQNITKPITVASVAEALNVSQSYLSHTFKRDMNISLHQYMLKKRLAMAHRKITDGEPAVKAAMECGFGDYSGFYKQFRKMYGHAPTGIGHM